MNQNPTLEASPTNTPVSSTPTNMATHQDYLWSITAGTLIGLLLLPILATARPTLYDKIWLFVPIFFIFASPAGLWIAAKLSRFVPVIWQLAKFILIGGLNTLVDIGVLATLITLFRNSFDISPDTVVLDTGLFAITVYSFYKGTSFIAANTNSYFWNKHWTFSGSTGKDESGQFLQFFVVSLLGFFINILVASYVFTAIPPIGGMNPSQWGLMGAAAGAIAGLGWNFLGYKFVVFKKE